MNANADNVLARVKRQAADKAAREHIECVLGTHHWCIRAAARELGIDRSNLKRLMRRYGIERLS